MRPVDYNFSAYFEITQRKTKFHWHGIWFGIIGAGIRSPAMAMIVFENDFSFDL